MWCDSLFGATTLLSDTSTPRRWCCTGQAHVLPDSGKSTSECGRSRTDDSAHPGDRPGHLGHEGHRRRSEAGQVARDSPRCRCARATSPAAGSSRTPRRCSTRCSPPAAGPWPQAGVPVAAVALANQGETVLAWDRDTGRPLTPAIVWQDRRAEAALRGAEPATPTELAAPHRAGARPVLLRAEDGAGSARNLTRAGVVTTTDTWLVHRLCGAFVTDASTASRSLLLDLDAVAWDPELVELFGLGGERAARHRRQRRDRRQHRRLRRRRFRWPG